MNFAGPSHPCKCAGTIHETAATAFSKAFPALPVKRFEEHVRCFHSSPIFPALVLRRGRWGFTTADRHAARLHGNFHCRNVFLAHNEAPLLIDFGRSDVYPRLFDFAALDTDLVISVMDSGKGADHAFQNVEKWFRRIRRSFPFSKKPLNERPKTKVELFRNILRAHTTSKLKLVSASEYGEVLIFHLLRYLRFPSVPPAKKILAIRLIDALAKQLGLLLGPGAFV